MSKLSFTTMGTPALNGHEAMRLAKKLGFQGVDLRISDTKGELTLKSSDADIKSLKDCSEAEGVEIAGLLCYNKTGEEDLSTWAEAYDDIMKHIEIAQKIGSPTIRLFGGPIHKYDPEKYLRSFSETLKKVISNSRGIKMLLQHHNNAPNYFQGKQLVDYVDHERFRLVFSPDHCLIMGDDLSLAFKDSAKYCDQIYMSDVYKKNDDWISVLPGKGEVDLKGAFDSLGGENFQGWVSFKWEKIWRDYLEEPEVALPFFINEFFPSISK